VLSRSFMSWPLHLLACMLAICSDNVMVTRCCEAAFRFVLTFIGIKWLIMPDNPLDFICRHAAIAVVEDTADRCPVFSYSRESALFLLAHGTWSGEVVACLFVWSEVQMICILSSWCHCHPSSLASAESRTAYSSGIALPRLPRKKAFKWVLLLL